MAAFYENDDFELINILNARQKRQTSVYCRQCCVVFKQLGNITVISWLLGEQSVTIP